jgi:hypothetical protein
LYRVQPYIDYRTLQLIHLHKDSAGALAGFAGGMSGNREKEMLRLTNKIGKIIDGSKPGWIKITFIALIIFSLVGISTLALTPTSAMAADAGTGYLLQKTITWGDGTVETVAIDSNGNFILDGVQRNLVGFCDPFIYAYGNPYDASNKEILQKELDYLQSKGVRIIHFNLWPWGEEAYDSVLQLYYDHKMLAVPLFSLIGDPVSGDLSTTDFLVDGTSTVSTFFATWLKHVKSFQNVVSIVIENEMDINLSYRGYTLSNATKYMDMLYNYAKANCTVPIVTKFGVLNYDAAAASVQNAFLHYSAVPCFDLYYTDASTVASGCASTAQWFSTKTTSSKMWVTEANYAFAREPGYYNAAKFTKEMVDAMFANKVAVVFLFSIQDIAESTSMFFDYTGNPITNLDTLLANIPTWQAPMAADPIVIGSPVQVAPANGSTISNLTPALSWNQATGASTYALQISTDSTFNSTAVNQTALTGTSFNVPAGTLLQGTTYNWRVAAKDASANSSAWSGVYTFTTPAAATLSAPALALPANGSTVSNVTPTVSWNQTAGASTYALQISIDSTFNSTVVNQTALTGTSYNVPAGILSQGTTYNWRVAAKDASNTSEWSSIYTFKTPTAVSTLIAPTLASPVNKATITNLTPTLIWKTVTGAASYSIQVSTDATFASTIIDKSAITRTSYTIPSGTLSWSTTYYWRARTTDKSGLNSTWSAAYTMNTSANPYPAAASNLTATVKSKSQVNLAWKDNSSNESGFKIERKTGTGAYSLVMTTRANVVSFSNTNLRANTTYTYRVTAYNAAGNAAPSNEVTITTPR